MHKLCPSVSRSVLVIKLIHNYNSFIRFLAYRHTVHLCMLSQCGCSFKTLCNYKTEIRFRWVVGFWVAVACVGANWEGMIINISHYPLENSPWDHFPWTLHKTQKNQSSHIREFTVVFCISLISDYIMCEAELMDDLVFRSLLQYVSVCIFILWTGQGNTFFNF